MPRTRMVHLDEITVDMDVNQRAGGINGPIVKQYLEDAENGAEFPPVVLYEDTKTYWLSDGFHRYEMAFRRKETAICAEVRKGGRKDAILNACGSNSEHGSRRTNADKRRAVVTLLEMYSKRSNRWIAEQAKVSHVFVANLKDQLVTVTNSQSGGGVVGIDGKTYQSRGGSSRNGSHQPSFPATKTFDELCSTVAGLHDRLAQSYEYKYSQIFKSDDWDDAYSHIAINRLGELSKIITGLKRELKEHANKVTKDALA